MVVNRSAPRATVVPILVYEDVGKAIDWLCDTFGFKERLRAAGPGGMFSHAQLVIGDGAVMLGRPGGEFQPPRPNEVSQYVTVHVEDVDEHFEHARQSGARIVKPPTDMPFGERQYTVEDPWGHRWTFSQSIADVAPEAWGAREPDGRERGVRSTIRPCGGACESRKGLVDNQAPRGRVWSAARRCSRSHTGSGWKETGASRTRLDESWHRGAGNQCQSTRC